MKKAGIVSFFSSENYGAILQALAFQQNLKSMGIEGVYIDYAPPVPIFGIKKIINRVYSVLRLLLGFRTRLKRTNEFRTKYLIRTNKIKDISDIKHIIGQFDLFIVGSDQVWNPRWLNVSHGFYLLSFADDKPKYSYASSFGVKEIPVQYIECYKKYLNKFTSLSVRENTGLNIIEKIGLKAQLVLDPTLLLSKIEWLKYFKNTPIITEKYIFCYVMSGDHQSADYIAKYAKKVNAMLDGGFKIIVVGDKEYKRFIPNYNLICNAGPAEFLNLLYYSSYVITNSYHGTCFSINFEKQFTTILKKDNLFNSRIIDLLKTLKLDSNICFTDFDINDCELNITRTEHYISYLNDMKNLSIQYLNKNIKNQRM